MTDWLGMAVRPRAPRPDLKQRVMARAIAAGQVRRPRIPLGVAASLLLLSLSVAAVFGGSEVLRLRRERDALAARLAGTRDTLDFLRRPGSRVYQIAFETAGRPGTLTIIADSATHRWLVACHHMTPNAPGEAYQVWFLTEAGPVSALVMPMRDPGPMIAAIPMPAARVVGAAMSVEPEGGSPEMRGPTIFKQRLDS